MKLVRRSILVGFLAMVGCSGGGGDSSGGNKIGIGSIIGGKYGSQIDTGLSAAGKGVQALSMNEGDEDELGQTVARAATNQWRLFDNAEMTRYVRMVGLTLADGSSRPDGNWVFGILDTPDIGAYSGPNGYIMVTRGAIAAMQDEAELAAVLAHEMSHVVHQDGLNAVKNAKMTAAFSEGMSAADRRIAMFNQFSDRLVETVLKSGWNQGQETSADEGAVKLLIAAGYDPGGLPRFLKRMQASGGGRAKPFGTHPGTSDRISRTTAQIGGKTGATNKDRFVKATGEARL